VITRETAPDGATRIDISAGRNPIVIIAVATWLTGWTVWLLAMAAQVRRFGIAGAPGAAILFVVLFLGGLAVLIALIWAASGYRETLWIRSGELRITRGSAWLGRSLRFPPFTVTEIEVIPGPPPVLRDWYAIRQFWTEGAGSLRISAAGQIFNVGVKLREADALTITADLESRIPLATPDSIRPRHRDVLVTGRRWVVGVINVMMLTPMVIVPFRAIVTDRVTCIGVSHEEPRSPVPSAALTTSGTVELVPIDDFPTETAESIAQHFRQRFGTPIRVEHPITAPRELFDNAAGQLNAHAMGAFLANPDAELNERRIVIGLSQADMYIPNYGWRYAFSYRYEDRVAVVSNARMRHGCLDIVEADESLQLARLRKMVGKNIALLYYRLPFREDPRSMRYRNVGGPQELDVMAETF
jgi:hypothetical protein